MNECLISPTIKHLVLLAIKYQLFIENYCSWILHCSTCQVRNKYHIILAELIVYSKKISVQIDWHFHQIEQSFTIFQYLVFLFRFHINWHFKPIIWLRFYLWIVPSYISKHIRWHQLCLFENCYFLFQSYLRILFHTF